MSQFSISDLDAAIDQFGADLETWPPATRQSAQSLLDSSPQARELLTQAAALEQALRGEEVKAPAGLVDRITSAARGLPQRPGKTRR